MVALSILIFILYVGSLSVLWLYSIGGFSLALRFWFRRKKSKVSPAEFQVAPEMLPLLTVQLPIYNEKYVVERLIDAIVAQDYPSDKLWIQMIDDSTDETTEIIKEKIKQLSSVSTLNIEHIRRQKRSGYKAGALAEAFPTIKGEYVAIFDADFVPRPDFLRKATGFLVNHPEFGLIQTRWEHLNEQDSILTRLQAFHLDAHFAVEQFVRSEYEWFMNFNGTAGVWRKTAISEGGGWQSDTLTEDLDLSYRSQLAGWKLHYVDSVSAPAELPALMSAVKSQQFRWMKGGAEVGKKLLRIVWKAPISLTKKIYATHHLLGSSVFICSLITGLMGLPTHLTLKYLPEPLLTGLYLSNYFFSSFFFFVFFYFTANSVREQDIMKGLVKTIVYIFPFLIFMMGMSLHNANAAWEGLISKKSAFIRTPKFSTPNLWKKNTYRERKMSGIIYPEILLAGYFSVSTIYLLINQDFVLLPFQFMLMLGYITIVLLTFKHTN